MVVRPVLVDIHAEDALGGGHLGADQEADHRETNETLHGSFLSRVNYWLIALNIAMAATCIAIPAISLVIARLGAPVHSPANHPQRLPTVIITDI